MARSLKNVLWTRKTREIPPRLENLILENPSSWLTRPFEVKELRWASRRLKNKKSDKPSGISNEEWEAIMKSRLTRDMILLLFNRVLQSEDFIGDWEQSELFCVFKKGDNKDPENYGLLALLDTLCKISTRMSTKRILDHIDSSMRNTRCAFREIHGCADALLVPESCWRRSLRSPNSVLL